MKKLLIFLVMMGFAPCAMAQHFPGSPFGGAARHLYDDLYLSGHGLFDDFVTFPDDDVAPSVAGGTFFLTGGVGADFAINDFTNTVTGKPFIVIINETVTDIDFAGAALSGHGELLLDNPPVNTMLLCIDDGTTINCFVSQPTILTLQTFVFPLSAAPAQTEEGSAVFDTVLHVLTIGTGAGRISIP